MFFKLLVKSVLIPLGLTVTASATDATIHKKMFGSGTTTSIIFNEEMNDIMKIIKYLEEFGLFRKVFSKTIENETKEPKKGFSNMLLGQLGATLLGNLLSGKGTIRAGEIAIATSRRQGLIRVVQDF